MSDNDVIEELDADKLSSPDKIPGKSPVFRRRRWIPGGMIMHTDQGRCVVLECMRHDFPGINRTAGKCSQEKIFISDKFVFPVEESTLNTSLVRSLMEWKR